MVSLSKAESTILFFLIVGSLTGTAVYISVEQLQLFRISLVVSAISAFYYLHFKDFKVDYRLKLIWLYFFISFIEAILISVFTENFNTNSFANYFFMNLFLSVLIYYASCDPHKFLKVIYFTSSAMFVIMLMVASWELTTGEHLPGSSIETKIGKSYIPTTFFCNHNDFLAMTTLMILFMLYYNKVQKNTSSGIIIIFAQINILLAFIAESKVNMIVSVVMLFIFMANKKNYKYMIFGLPVIFLGSFFYFEAKDIDIATILLGQKLESGDNSSIIRKELYKLAFSSVGENFGFGFGLNNSSYFYISQHDNLLMGIINPHNYLLEILINNGIFVFSFYIALNAFFAFIFLKNKQYLLAFYLMCYYIILMSSSSSIFLWYHYVFIISLVIFNIISTSSYEFKKTFVFQDSNCNNFKN